MEHLLCALHWASGCRAQVVSQQKLTNNPRIKHHETNQEMLPGGVIKCHMDNDSLAIDSVGRNPLGSLHVRGST